MKPFLLFLGVIMLGVIFSVSASAQPAPEQPAKPQITFKGGSGETPESAVVILGAPNSIAGIAAEYSYLKKKFGRENDDWLLIRQSVLNQKDKVYDRMDLDLKDGSKKSVFFDISEFFGKI